MTLDQFEDFVMEQITGAYDVVRVKGVEQGFSPITVVGLIRITSDLVHAAWINGMLSANGLDPQPEKTSDDVPATEGT